MSTGTVSSSSAATAIASSTFRWPNDFCMSNFTGSSPPLPIARLFARRAMSRLVIPRFSVASLPGSIASDGVCEIEANSCSMHGLVQFQSLVPDLPVPRSRPAVASRAGQMPWHCSSCLTSTPCKLPGVNCCSHRQTPLHWSAKSDSPCLHAGKPRQRSYIPMQSGSCQ